MHEVSVKELKDTPNVVLELSAQLARREGYTKEATTYLIALQWRITAQKILKTRSWRLFKRQRLFKDLDRLDHELRQSVGGKT